ncbi:Predicted thiol-disulfide oxidoreductase YuxK, DCC family [Thalassobacillus cyri]|uniref:Predicted thiol-disulfide oxidoreductase YuxK, DCC family n=1 Tax=Thalassobacillus cyri TaxID=571932 RepID=A0A1H4H606_9BACI|nr:DUF393 domain-containing protein [Thalassobacillus cyri]SEB16518.1 Predicted thiol-disulfide oxidoreductase YuxK, DCC family [Thalassobacillus cyri]
MKHTVFYDAQCPLCFSIKRVLRRLDWFNKLEWIPVQEVEKSNDFRYLAGKDIYDQIYMRTSNGKLLAGFYTIRKLLVSLPLTFYAGVLMYLPFASRLGSPLYKWISKNRYDWFGRYETPRK